MSERHGVWGGGGGGAAEIDCFDSFGQLVLVSFGFLCDLSVLFFLLLVILISEVY